MPADWESTIANLAKLQPSEHKFELAIVQMPTTGTSRGGGSATPQPKTRQVTMSATRIIPTANCQLRLADCDSQLAAGLFDARASG